MRFDQIQPLIVKALRTLQSGDPAGAARVATDVLRAAPQEPTSLMICGLAAHARGDLKSALEYLTRADTAAPRNPMILSNLGVVYRSLDQPHLAEAAYRKALSADPKHLPTQVNLARLLDQLGKLDQAEAEFRSVLSSLPHQGDALAGLASVLEQMHRLDEAATVARKALAADRSVLAGLTLAKVAVRMKRADEALAEVASLRSMQLTPINAALADGLEGQALEILGRYNASFLSHKRANDTLRTIYEPLYGNARSIVSSELLAGIVSYFNSNPDHSAVSHAGAGRLRHTFLLGFPRSGTTLLEQALAAHPDVQTLEEKNTLEVALADLVAAPSAATFFESLNSSTLERYRSAYWEAVRRELGATPSSKVFIDKMPINSAYMGLIVRLFPDAHFIFAIRDPRDVILSCFQQRFGMNAVMFEFLTLGSTAALYDKVMSAAFAAREALKLEPFEIRYEELTADFEKVLRELTVFLGLQWRSEVLDYRQQSKDRFISTPSAAQIMEPVTTRAVGRFRAYMAELTPIMPVANAWAAKFGYPVA